MQDTAKIELRRKFESLNAYVRKEEHLRLSKFKKLKKDEQVKPKANREKGVIKIQAEIKWNDHIKQWKIFKKRIPNIGKPLAKMSKK